MTKHCRQFPCSTFRTFFDRLTFLCLSAYTIITFLLSRITSFYIAIFSFQTIANWSYSLIGSPKSRRSKLNSDVISRPIKLSAYWALWLVSSKCRRPNKNGSLQSGQNSMSQSNSALNLTVHAQWRIANSLRATRVLSLITLIPAPCHCH